MKTFCLSDKTSWTIGLVNSSKMYMTQETFGNKINANGKTMKKKQMWTVEPSGDGTTVCLKSHLGKFLIVDKFGNVTCESEEKEDNTNPKFEMSIMGDKSGRIAFKSMSRGYFLGAASDELVCSAKSPGQAELWVINIAARPQVNIKSIGRKRFARLSDNQTEIQVDENMPWGSDALFTLQFVEESKRYAIHTSNSKYLKADGSLSAELSQDCLFVVEIHGENIALMDNTGRYLSPGSGSQAVLKTKSDTVTKSEQFSLQDSQPQASFQAVSNKRFVSCSIGMDVTANQDEISDNETFQLEFQADAAKWNFRTLQDKYFSVQPGGGVQAGEARRPEQAPLQLIWQDNGTVAMKADNGKFVGAKKSGHLFANVDVIEDNSRFFFYLTNRPIMILKCEQGFVGYRMATSVKLDCNKASYATFQVERAEGGLVHFKGQNGKYWQVVDGGIACDSENAQGFYLELREPTKVCIKTAGGNYLIEKRNGGFNVGGTDEAEATRWEW